MSKKELTLKDLPLSKYDGTPLEFVELYHIPDKRMKVVVLVEKEMKDKTKYKQILVKRWKWGTNQYRKTPGWIREENNSINPKSSVWEKEKDAVDGFIEQLRGE